jgi:hypothetical protein
MSEIKLHFSDKYIAQCSKKIYKYRTGERMSELKSHIVGLIRAAEPGQVWVPTDFAQLGSRDAVDKTLQRMVLAGELRRIERGLYDSPKLNSLTKRSTTPDYRAVTEAIARRDQLRLLVDGMTAANDLGLTDAVPARVTIHTDTRRRAVQLDKLIIEFKQTAPSRLYWAGRPAMRVVQALHWLKDTLISERSLVLSKLTKVLADPVHGAEIRQDLLEGFHVLPAWMQSLVRELPGCERPAASAATRQSLAAPPPVHHRSVKHVEPH